MKISEISPDQVYRRGQKVFAYLLGAFILIFALAQVVAANQTAASGEQVKALEDQADQLKTENKKLNLEIARATSMQKIGEEAVRLGYKKTSSYVFLSSPLPVALNLK